MFEPPIWSHGAWCWAKCKPMFPDGPVLGGKRPGCLWQWFERIDCCGPPISVSLDAGWSATARRARSVLPVRRKKAASICQDAGARAFFPRRCFAVYFPGFDSSPGGWGICGELHDQRKTDPPPRRPRRGLRNARYQNCTSYLPKTPATRSIAQLKNDWPILGVRDSTSRPSPVFRWVRELA